ncbi:hypothetical protein AVEN_131087-1 [Araneus ventricosus]|uniref:Uncharacterized protein n=1 Tax=Araneus ventricosus TaxID=182803 RepID=A0A4Y2GFX6_ARAVE|nr:hypothetical protein AVEN_131087-1 [Araneus ventricosus]
MLWIKIEIARGKNGSECSHGLLEVCALPYRTDARWDKAFCAVRNETADLHRICRLSIPQHQIDIASGLLSIDGLWTVRNYPWKIVSIIKRCGTF